MSDDMVHAAAGDAVKALLTRWAVAYGGTCERDEASQLARPVSLRSQCRACAAADPTDWALTGPCDLCSCYVSEPGRWWVADPDRTAGIGVLMRLCLTCSRRELADYDDDPEEDEMTTTCCPDCMRTFARAALRTTRGHDFSGMHPGCREALAKGLRGYGPATKGDPDLNSRIRIVLATRALRGAA